MGSRQVLYEAFLGLNYFFLNRYYWFLYLFCFQSAEAFIGLDSVDDFVRQSTSVAGEHVVFIDILESSMFHYDHIFFAAISKCNF